MQLNDVNLRVAISPKCNMDCIYCEGAKGYSSSQLGTMDDFRKSPLKNGCISTETLLAIIKTFHEVGFVGLTLTGGEPLLNKDWDMIVKGASNIGMLRVEINTNGSVINDYLDEKATLPKELTLVKISLDTHDPERFKTITRGGNLADIIKAVRRISPLVKTRANKVLMRNDLGGLVKYFNFCHEIGFQEINLLDLVYHSNLNSLEGKNFFEKEYVSFSEVKKYFFKNLRIDFNELNKYGHSLTLPSGMKIIMKDSNTAVRCENCLDCPVYCQEGIYTVRIATDGNITFCPDFKGELPSINGPFELENGTLKKTIKLLASKINSAKKIGSFKNYADRHDLLLKRITY